VLAVAGRRQVRAWRWPLFALAGAGGRAIVAEGGPLDYGDWTRLGDGHTWARLVSGPAPRAPQAPQARVR